MAAKQLKEAMSAKAKEIDVASLPMPKEAASQSVAVYARLKPVEKGEARGDIKVRSNGAQGNVIAVRNLEFALESVFEENDGQDLVFLNAGKERVKDVLGGRNATILAYGQTGSGKTHTMFGPQSVLADFMACDPAQRGIVPRACLQIFDSLSAEKREVPRVVRCTYIEVYNDRLHDLLGGCNDLKMMEGTEGVTIGGVTEEEVTTTQGVMELLVRGNGRRVVAAMKMNARSSRGHAILSVQVVEKGAHGSEIATKLNLVDLAGMESSKKSYSVEGASNNPARREEAKNINVSLYALGTVIEKLSNAAQAGHVPYRNSKLTRLLQDSLGGNSRCAILVTIRTEAPNIDESIATLRLARRAAVVKTVSKESTIKVKDPTKLFSEIESLSSQLEKQHDAVIKLQSQLAQRDALEKELEEQRRKEAERQLEWKTKQEQELRQAEAKREEERKAKEEAERKEAERRSEELRIAAEEARKKADEAQQKVEDARREEQQKAAAQARDLESKVKSEAERVIEEERARAAEARQRAEELEKKMAEEEERRKTLEAQRTAEERARQEEYRARQEEEARRRQEEFEAHRREVEEKHKREQQELLALLERQRAEEAKQREQLAKLQERLIDEAEEAEKVRAEREDEAILQKIEEELKLLNEAQEERQTLYSEVAETRAAAALQAELYAEQAEQLARLQEAEARRLAREVELFATKGQHSPQKAIGAASDLTNKFTREAEIRKSLKAELLGLDQEKTFGAILAEAIDVAAKFSSSSEELGSVISAVTNGLAADLHETCKSVFTGVAHDDKVREALHSLQFTDGAAIIADSSDTTLESLSPEDLLKKVRDLTAQLATKSNEVVRLKEELKIARLPSRNDATELAAVSGMDYQLCVKTLLECDNDVMKAANRLLNIGS